MTLRRCLLALVVATAACGARTGVSGDLDATDAGRPPDASFAGTYDCTGVCGQSCTTTFAFTITQSPGELTLQFGGIEPCALTYTPSGNTATIQPGQSCTAQETTFSYTEGELTLTGDTLQMHEAFTRILADGAPDGEGADDETCFRRNADAGP